MERVQLELAFVLTKKKAWREWAKSPLRVFMDSLYTNYGKRI